MLNTNTLKTTIFLGGLGALLVVIGETLGGGAGALIGLIIGIGFAGSSYWFSDKLALRSAQAQPVSEQQMPDYYRIVRELAQKDGIPMPTLYVAPSMQPNAFATGRNPNHAAVAVTQGILGVLDWHELQGVLAHELSHVKNRDILISSVAAAVAMSITYIAQIAQFGMLFGGGGRNNDDERENVLVSLALIILAPLAATVMQLALSRSREFQADRSGAELMGSGESLARALEKLIGALNRFQ